MNNEKTDTSGWATPTCDVMTSDWQLGLVDLTISNSGVNMPDVKLEALCDIIFANLTLQTRF